MLRDYQVDCITEIFKNYRAGVRRQLIVLPTGTGKTVIFAQLATNAKGRALIIVNRDELISQTVSKLEDAGCFSIGIEKGEKTATAQDKCIVASVQSLRANRLDKYGRGDFSLIIIDEAHHAAAPSYRALVDHLTTKDVALLGFTATPDRADGKDLAEVFDQICYKRTIVDMITAGWLVPVHGKMVKTSVNLDEVKCNRGDYQIAELSSAVNNPQRNLEIVKSYTEYANNRKTIVFCVDVAHANSVNAKFNECGIPCLTVSGEMDISVRRETVNKFKTGEVRIITNCMILTEGFDDPGVECVIMARPTKSNVLYSQMLGRGIRLFGTSNYLESQGAKENLLVIDLVDNTEKLSSKAVNVGEMFGCGCVLNSEDVLETGKRMRELLDEYPGLAAIANKHTLAELEKIVLQGNDISIYISNDSSAELGSQYGWIKTERGYYIAVGSVHRYELVQNELGQWDALHHERLPVSKYRTKFVTHYALKGIGTLKEAVTRIERQRIETHHSDCIGLIDVSKAWRKKPASDKQLGLIKKLLKTPFVQGARKITMGEAANIINSLMAKGA